MNSTQLGQTSDYLELVPCVTMESKANSCYASNTTMRSKKMTSVKGTDFQQEVGCRQVVQIRDRSSSNTCSEVAHKMKNMGEHRVPGRIYTARH